MTRIVLGGALASLGVLAHLAVDAIAGFDDALVPLDDDLAPALAA